jgi:hypothetical protein
VHASAYINLSSPLSGNNLYLNISAKVDEDDWVAIAFSQDTDMGEDDVVAVYRNISTTAWYTASLIDPEGRCLCVVLT